MPIYRVDMFANIQPAFKHINNVHSLKMTGDWPLFVWHPRGSNIVKMMKATAGKH